MAEESKTSSIELSVGDVILYYDDRSERPIDVSGCNQWAIAVEDQIAIVNRPSGIICVRIEDILRRPHLNIRKNPYSSHAANISAYFIRNRRHRSLYEAGERSLLVGNLQIFENGSLFPQRPEYSSVDEFERAWSFLLSSSKPMDVIFTVRFDSLLSRFIAWATHGPFSHVALYVGEGEIFESVTSGLRRGGLTDLYKDRNNWVATYRHVQHLDRTFTHEEAKSIAEQTMASYRPGYNWLDAGRHGLRSFRGNHEQSKAPNSWLYQGSYQMVAQA